MPLAAGILQFVIPTATFLGGLVAGLYFDDYREDRNWCRNVDAVLTDVDMAVDEIQAERNHPQENLQTAADRLDVLITETPTYRHGIRRQLEPLREELEHLAGLERWGIPMPDYDHDNEPDSRDEVDRIDYIVDKAGELRDRTYEIDKRLSYGIFSLIPVFLYHNLVPNRLRR